MGNKTKCCKIMSYILYCLKHIKLHNLISFFPRQDIKFEGARVQLILCVMYL